MVEGGSSADVIAYTTTQGYGVVVVQPVRLCASKKKKTRACHWAAISVLPRARLLCVVAASACAWVRRGRALMCRLFPARVSTTSLRSLRASWPLLCQQISGVLPVIFRLLPPSGSNVRRGPDYVRRLRAFVRTGSDRFGGHAGDRDCKRHSLAGLPGPCPGRFIRQMKGF